MANPLDVDTIFEEREELMISPTGDGDSTFRTAHFLKSSSTSIDGPVSKLPSSIPLSSGFDFSDHKTALQVKFKGRRNPPNNWKAWAESLRARYEPTWRKAGIYEAIMNSTYHLMRDNDLIIGVAEKWCPETNSFVFPWGEATITLEDMMVLCGYSVLGDPAANFSPLEITTSTDLRMVLDDLSESYTKIAKANAVKQATTYPWMEHFMGTGHRLEHEAFLSLWLSRFVFPFNLYDIIGKKLFPIAIRLARGIRVALAPPVLASIYKDLSLLKEEMVKFVRNRDKYSCLLLDLWAPFQYVQLWAWERFPTLRPKPNLIIKEGEPRAARWHRISKIKVDNVRMALDSAGDCFQWRPYTSIVNNLHLPKFYREKEEWVMVDSDLDKDLESFALCLRFSELVGLGFAEQYLPHRVAMQFGIDQDIPGFVPRSNKNPWSNYSRPIGDKRLYIPARLFESDVTTRYLEWWKQSMLLQKDEVWATLKKPRSVRRRKNTKQGKEVIGSISEGEFTLLEALRSIDKEDNDGNELVRDGKPSSGTLSESLSSCSANHGMLGEGKPRYKSLEEIIVNEASMGTMKGADEGRPKRAVDTISIKNKNGEHSDNGTVKKPKLESEDHISEIDKVIAELKAEYRNRLFHNQVKIQSPAELERVIAELKEEFGQRIRQTT